MKNIALLMFFASLIATQVCQVDLAEAKQVMVDAQVLEQLQQLLADQQKQLQKLQKQVDEFQQTATAAQTQAQEAKAVAEEAKSKVLTTAGKGAIVSSGQERVKLTVSGQVNKAVNVINDGDETDVYFVDNGNSNSRLRFIGTAQVDEDLTLGSKFEVAIAPDMSTKVSQEDQESGDFFDQRVAEIFLLSNRYGALYLGKGSTASDGTAEVDLSGTDVVQYASYGDIAGGMLFRDSFDDELTGIEVSDAFNDFDGLSRKSRLRYDPPTFYGFGLAGSVITESRWDAALRWSGSGYGFKAGAAAAVAFVNTTGSDYQYDGSLSVLHIDTGLNFTFSAGTKDSDMNDDPYSVWGKLGWQTTFFSVGKTSFGVDYGISEHLTADGDEGSSIGAAVVQSFADYGTELYFQLRQYSLDRAASAGVEDINVGTIGARVKF